MDPRTKALLMTVRCALIMVLNGLEDFLGLPRSVERKGRTT